MILNSFLVLVQGWTSFKDGFHAVDFVSLYVELPVMLIMFLVWKFLKKTKFVKAEEMDLETDVYKPEVEEEDFSPAWRSRGRKVLNWLF